MRRRLVRTQESRSDDMASHLFEIECRQRAVSASTDPDSIAWLEYWATMHRRAIGVSLATAGIA